MKQDPGVKKVQTVFSPRHQRFALVCLAILVQAGVFALMLLAFSRYFAYFQGYRMGHLRYGNP